MLTQLLVLWLLSERALSGYRLQRILLDPSVGLWLRIEPASIYSVLRTLVRLQAVEAAEPAARESAGRAAEYRITRKGRARLRELALRAWSAPVADFAAAQVAFAVRQELEPREVEAGLRHRLERINQELGGIGALARRAFDARLVERMQALLAADQAWLEATLKSLQH